MAPGRAEDAMSGERAVSIVKNNKHFRARDAGGPMFSNVCEALSDLSLRFPMIFCHVTLRTYVFQRLFALRRSRSTPSDDPGMAPGRAEGAKSGT